MFKALKSAVAGVFFALGLLFASASANAAALSIDVADVVSTITGAIVTLSSIGIAVLSLTVLIKLFKWVARVL